MHNLVAMVFKALGLTIIMLLVFDLSLFLVDVSNATEQITSVLNLVKTEVARNNCILDVTADSINEMLQEIDDKSNVFNNLALVAPDEDHILQYGDASVVKITTKMSPFSVDGTMPVISNALENNVVYDVNFEAKTICLRYIK